MNEGNSDRQWEFFSCSITLMKVLKQLEIVTMERTVYWTSMSVASTHTRQVQSSAKEFGLLCWKSREMTEVRIVYHQFLKMGDISDK